MHETARGSSHSDVAAAISIGLVARWVQVPSCWLHSRARSQGNILPVSLRGECASCKLFKKKAASPPAAVCLQSSGHRDGGQGGAPTFKFSMKAMLSSAPLSQPSPAIAPPRRVSQLLCREHARQRISKSRESSHGPQGELACSQRKSAVKELLWRLGPGSHHQWACAW
jgi:hypothetical protein